jgi:FkbM family methyltransferase
MRLEDVFDYFKLKQIAYNPYEVVRFRKVKDENRLLTVKLKDGYKMFVQGGTDQYHTFHRVFLRDEYQINQCEDKKMECVIDLEANVGYLSIRMARLAERVISCEAIKANVEKLVMNRDGRQNIHIMNKAIAGKRGFINLFKPTVDGCCGRYSMIFNDNSKNENAFESVQCITLDELFDEHKIGKCDLVKMDIEGAEYETLYNASDETLKRIDRIVGEYHHFDKVNKENTIQSLKRYLIKKGYRVLALPKKRKGNIGLFFCERH